MIDDILGTSTAQDHRSSASGPSYTNANSDEAVDSLLRQKTSILQTKLGILAYEITQRLTIRRHNLQRVSDDAYRVGLLLAALDRKANYHLREHREKGAFYELLFALEREKRDQDVSCWQDVANVMRDFLEVWEAHEQAKARARLLDAGP